MSEFNSEEKLEQLCVLLKGYSDDNTYSGQLNTTVNVCKFLEDIHTTSFDSGYKMGLNAQLNQKENEQ